MSLYTAAFILCILSLSAAADFGGALEDLSTAPSARSLLAKTKRKKSEKKGPTVLFLGFSATEGVHTIRAGKSSGGNKRGHQHTTGKDQKTTPPGTSNSRGRRRSPSRRPRSERAPSSYYVSYETNAPGSSSFFESYGSGDADLNKVPAVEERGIEAEELPHGEMDLSYKGHKSASKSPPSKAGSPKAKAKPAPKRATKPTLKPASKPAPKAEVSTGYTARGVVTSVTGVRIGFGRSRSPRRPSRRFPRRTVRG